jgi:hypothetical protein
LDFAICASLQRPSTQAFAATASVGIYGLTPRKEVSGVPEKSRAKSKPTQAGRRILYVQTGIDLHRLMSEPCCASQQNLALDFRFRVLAA